MLMIKSIVKWIYRIICVIIVTICAINPMFYLVMPVLTLNGVIPDNMLSVLTHPAMPYLFVVLFAAVNVFPSLANRILINKRHRICADGAELLIIFMISLTIGIAALIAGSVGTAKIWGNENGVGIFVSFGGTVLTGIIILSVIFWNGIIRIYMTSLQLGIRYRVWGIILGWVFPANLVMLSKMIRIVSDEVWFENDKAKLNASRSGDMICKTRYPILLVHGVFFRDFKQGFLNYWGRIPDELTANGAVLFYGSQQSAASVAKCGAEIADRIRQIVAETGCEKVNIIGHSKGGLDSRYAISKCGVSDMVASLTTINTPHRGCEFADYLLNKISPIVQKKVASAYNSALLRLGDHDPDFLEAVNDLTHSSCEKLNEEVKDADGVFYQSFGSHMKKAGGGRFPLNYSFHLVKYFDGRNDGLVGEGSFEWGEQYRFLEPAGDRGISHGDMIDLNRENIPDFDVREFYVQLVSVLKKRGF